MTPRVLSALGKLAGRSPHELWTRAAQRAWTLVERRQSARRASGSQDFLRPSGRTPEDRPAAFFRGVQQASSTIDALRVAVPADQVDVLARADRIANGQVLVFGHGWIDIGRTPNWHREPVAGLVAPRGHWSRIPYLDPDVVGDHKVLWEFNRHQQFVTLGQAWRYSADERWVQSWKAMMTSWLDQNPPREGANWASSLEVAYRAISWCWATQLFGSAATTDRAFHGRLLDSADAHGRHVARYLSTYFSPNTHLTGEALGLYYLGTTFPALAHASRWREQAREILEGQLGRQVHADGVYFEQASQYHRYTIEIYLHYLLLAEASGQAVSDALRQTLNRMFDVLSALTRDDGTMPLIGDDDGGRLLPLDGDRPHETRELLATGALVLERPDLAVASRGAATMAAWLLGADAPARLSSLARDASPTASSVAFRDGGIFVMRDADGEGHGHAVIDAGPHGALSYGHSHADALAMELYAGNGPLFVDVGTLTYVGPERNLFRATAAHNSVEIGGLSAPTPGAAFKWLTVGNGVCDGWAATAGADWFTGHHDGYSRFEPTAGHQRSVFHPDAGVWVIEDRVDSPALPAVLRWHCAPEVKARIAKAWTGGAEVELQRAGVPIATVLIAAGAGEVRLEQGTVSPQYGAAVAGTVIRCDSPPGRDIRLRSVVLDWTVANSASVVLAAEDAALRLVERPPAPGSSAVRHELFVGSHTVGSEVSSVLTSVSQSQCTWVRRSADGSPSRIVALGVTSGVPASLDVAVRSGAEWRTRSASLFTRSA